MSVDPLVDWWVHEVIVHRWTGSGAYGDTFDPPLDQPGVTLLGFVHDGAKLVVNAGGQQVTSSAQVALPIAADYVPVKSQVQLPASFGHAPGDPSSPRTSTVIASARGDGGGQPTPDHYVLALQ